MQLDVDIEPSLWSRSFSLEISIQNSWSPLTGPYSWTHQNSAKSGKFNISITPLWFYRIFSFLLSLKFLFLSLMKTYKVNYFWSKCIPWSSVNDLDIPDIILVTHSWARASDVTRKISAQIYNHLVKKWNSFSMYWGRWNSAYIIIYYVEWITFLSVILLLW